MDQSSPASPRGHGCWRSRRAIRPADLHAGRRFQGLQPRRAAGGRKNIYPGRRGAFPQGTPVHFDVQGTGISQDADRLPGLTGLTGLFIDPLLPVGRPPYHRGARGRVLVVCCASEGRQRTRAPQGRSTKARVCHDAAVRHRTATQARTLAAPATSKGPKNGSMWEGVTASCAAGLSVEPGGWCGSRPLTAASWHRGHRTSVRPACDRWILWQAHKARREVDTTAQADVKQRALTSKCDGLAPASFSFAVVAKNHEG